MKCDQNVHLEARISRFACELSSGRNVPVHDPHVEERSMETTTGLLSYTTERVSEFDGCSRVCNGGRIIFSELALNHLAGGLFRRSPSHGPSTFTSTQKIWSSIDPAPSPILHRCSHIPLDSHILNMPLFILAETSAGYAILKSSDKKLLQRDGYAESMESAEGARSMYVKAVQLPYKTIF